jgi:hypothetical protein
MATNLDTIKYEDLIEEKKMIQIDYNYEGGSKNNEGDLSEEYEYGQEQENTFYIQQPQDS